MPCENRYIASTPSLLYYHDDIVSAAKRGTIVFYHGLASCKEQGSKECNSLARAGYLACAVDNVGHGARRFPDFDERFSSEAKSFETEFVAAVEQTAQELPAILTFFEEQYGATAFGLSGISMGGFICYRAITLERRITVAASILGSPQWRLVDDRSPHLHGETFWPCAILSQNAADDQSVPPANTRRFHERLASCYQDAPERQQYIEYAGEGHFMSERAWNALWENVLQWFARFLGC